MLLYAAACVCERANMCAKHPACEGCRCRRVSLQPLQLTCCGVMPVKLNMPICCVTNDQSLSGQRFSSAACSSDLTRAMRPAIIAICTQRGTAQHVGHSHASGLCESVKHSSVCFNCKEDACLRLLPALGCQALAGKEIRQGTAGHMHAGTLHTLAGSHVCV